MRLSRLKQTKSVDAGCPAKAGIDIDSLEEYRSPNNKSIRLCSDERASIDRERYWNVYHTAFNSAQVFVVCQHCGEIHIHGRGQEPGYKYQGHRGSQCLAGNNNGYIILRGIMRDTMIDESLYLRVLQNGTIDLRAGQIREHRQADLITRVANVEYDRNADCPVWKKFLMEIMNYKADLIHFIQNAWDWAITGDTSEQTMFILFGTGANGKSTFFNTVMNLLGDYAIATPTETFTPERAILLRIRSLTERGWRFPLAPFGFG